MKSSPARRTTHERRGKKTRQGHEAEVNGTNKGRPRKEVGTGDEAGSQLDVQVVFYS